MARSSLTLLAVVALMATLLLSPPSGLVLETRATLLSHLREKREEPTQRRRTLDRERNQTQQVARKKQSLVAEVDRIDRELQRKGKELKAKQTGLQASAERLQATRRDLRPAKAQLDQIQGLFRRRIRAVYKQGRHSYVQALLSSKDLSAVGRRIRYLVVIANQDRQVMATYADALETLSVHQSELEQLKAKLTMDQKTVAAKREEIMEVQQNRRLLLTKIRDHKQKRSRGRHP